MGRLGWCHPLMAALLLASTGLAQDEVPSVQTFKRRGSSRASVIGNYIYFDGGEIAQEGYTDFRFNNPVNATLSIDLSVSWAPENVEIRELTRPSQMLPMTKQVIFTDQSTGIFYIWGGHVSWSWSPEEPVLWHFVPDGEGGGNWTTEDPGSAHSTTLEDAERVESAAYATAFDAGFVIGGRSTERTSLEPRGNMPGILIFNFTTQEWTRESAAPYSSDGSLHGGTATYVPNFGPNGIVVILGGLSRYNEDDNEYIDFQTVYFFDPMTREWYSQVTTGEAPSGRHYHCTAGVAGSNGTYEIFVFGGWNLLADSHYSDFYVLTLPGFRWTRISGLDSVPRAEHGCTVVGNRQMLSWGGVDMNNEEEHGWYEQDPFPQGIGIFDMSDFEWRTEYDASADRYESNSEIQEWYGQGGLDSVEWSSDEVRQLFVTETENGGNNDNGTDTGNNRGDGDGNSPPSETPSGGDGGNDEEDDSDNTSTSVGATVGGVIGGVAGLALLGLGAWFYLRRRRMSSTQLQEMEQPESKRGPIPPASYGPAHTLQQSGPHELASQVPELHDHSMPAELRSDTSYGREYESR